MTVKGWPDTIMPAQLLDPKAFQKNQKAGNEASTPKPQSADSARRLLDPKGLSDRQIFQDKSDPAPRALHGPSNLSLSQPSEPDLQQDGQIDDSMLSGSGIGSHIERLHGITERSERPVKRVKREDPDETEHKKKGPLAAIRKGGELGDYIKEKEKEVLRSVPQNIASQTVDLTAEDDTEEVIIVSETNTQEVCYGRIDAPKINAHLVPTPSGKGMNFGNSMFPAMKLTLKRLPGKDHVIRVVDPTNRDFGTVDLRTSVGLARIMDSNNPKCRTQARLSAQRREANEWPGSACSRRLEMTINLYGPRNKAEQIGKWLSQRQIYLRTPISSDHNIELYNPHAPIQTTPRTSGISRSSGTNGASGYASRTVEEVRNDVQGMFDALEKSRELPEVEADPSVLTSLMSHQKQGLYFLKSKEKLLDDSMALDNSLWRQQVDSNRRTQYCNVITGQVEYQKPNMVLGGILADMMGLGKTLSILALIVSSAVQADHFATGPPPNNSELNLLRNSKTTLLVAPLSTLANWEDQIATHIKPKTLTYYIYHGPNRLADIEELAKYDIIITTYSIVSSDFMGRGKRRAINPLFQTNFYRIVLDEAHMIREQATRQSLAICALAAERRWAVTGTPVQNRLEDLGSLLKFLRVRPFSDKGGFAQWILAPFKNADPDIIAKLRVLVDSFTLRRLKDRIDLPARHDRIVKLRFDEEESRLYEWFAKDSRNRLQLMASDKLKLAGKTYAHILRAIMRLRLICAHGRELLSEEDLRITEGYSRSNAIDLDSDDSGNRELNPRQAYELLMLSKESGTDSCVSCGKTIEPKDEPRDTEEAEVIGCMLPCYQLLCKDCATTVQAQMNESSAETFKCPFCHSFVPNAFFELTKEGMEEAEEARESAQLDPRRAKVLGRYGGPHTKVKTLIEDLIQSGKESEQMPLEPPIKSVVFSGWTTNLDLIQIALEDQGINFVRLDGKMSRKSRNTALETFREDVDVRVILISINAGGLGLNLTSASKVYIMEPQFNPAAEAQAVDRVHRLGQRREVFISRFIMEHSFEEKMLQLQRRKQDLAELSMSRGKLDKGEAAKKKLDDLKSLFR